MKHAQHDETIFGDAILKNVLGPQHFKHELPIASVFAEWISKIGTCFQNARLRENFAGHDCGEPRMAVMQEGSKAIEIGERHGRSFQPH